MRARLWVILKPYLVSGVSPRPLGHVLRPGARPPENRWAHVRSRPSPALPGRRRRPLRFPWRSGQSCLAETWSLDFGVYLQMPPIVQNVRQPGRRRPRGRLGDPGSAVRVGLTRRTRGAPGSRAGARRAGGASSGLTVRLNWVKAKLNAEALCAN